MLKTPVPTEAHPPELQPLARATSSSRWTPTREESTNWTKSSGRRRKGIFGCRLDDLAHDVCCMLEMLEASEREASSGAAVPIESRDDFLGGSNVGPSRAARSHQAGLCSSTGTRCFRTRDTPFVGSRIGGGNTRRSRSVPDVDSLGGQELQLRPRGQFPARCWRFRTSLRSKGAMQGNFSRLLWIPPGLQVEDERQRKVIEQLRMDPRTQNGADLLETPLEDLRTVIQDRLKKPPKPAPEARPSSGGRDETHPALSDLR